MTKWKTLIWVPGLVCWYEASYCQSIAALFDSKEEDLQEHKLRKDNKHKKTYRNIRQRTKFSKTLQK